MYYIIQTGVMQIMNLIESLKNLWCAITAFKTIESMPDSVLYVDSDGLVIMANEKAFDCFRLLKKDINNIEINEFIKDGMSMIQYSIKIQQPVPALAKIPGRDFYVELNAVEQDFGYCVTIRDLTMLTKEIVTEDKIARFNGEKNAMLVKLERDIKAPITSISGFSQGLLDGLGGNLTEKQEKYIKIIHSNSRSLYKFMDCLLEFTYAESSLYESKYKNFDVVEALKDVFKTFEKDFEEKNLDLGFDYYFIDKRLIYTDAAALEKIIKNIIHVAFMMTDTGSVEVKLINPEDELLKEIDMEDKNCLQIQIKDTGIGFQEEEMKYLCEPYGQLQNGKKNFLRALMLGTASILTKRINGHINISSDIVQGTIYDIIIPIGMEDDE